MLGTVQSAYLPYFQTPVLSRNCYTSFILFICFPVVGIENLRTRI